MAQYVMSMLRVSKLFNCAASVSVVFSRESVGIGAFTSANYRTNSENHAFHALRCSRSAALNRWHWICASRTIGG